MIFTHRNRRQCSFVCQRPTKPLGRLAWQPRRSDLHESGPMADRTAAEVMCCPEGCEKDTMARLRGECHASAFVRLIESIHAAGFMIVPREATRAMIFAPLDRNC